MKNEANVFTPKTPVMRGHITAPVCLTNNINCCEVQRVRDTFAVYILLVCFLALIAFMCVCMALVQRMNLVCYRKHSL